MRLPQIPAGIMRPVIDYGHGITAIDSGRIRSNER
jgi:hypothetical protein